MFQRYTVLFIVIFFIAPVFVFGKTYTRSELLDEGRNSLDTISKYKKMSDDSYPASFLLRFTTFYDYKVDTKLGDDKTDVMIGGVSAKVPLRRFNLGLYFIADVYDFSSQKRRNLRTKTEDGEKVPSKNSDGDYNLKEIKYGSLLEMFTGFDYNIADIVKINLGCKITKEELNNCDYDRRDISGISKNSDGVNIYRGEQLYNQVDSKKKTEYHPVFGVTGLDNLKSTISYSQKISAIDAAENILRYRFSKEIGYIGAGHTYYRYWNNDNGIAFNWEKLLNFMDFGTEFLNREKAVSNVYLGLESPELRLKPWVHMIIGARVNAARTPETTDMSKPFNFLPGGSLDVSFLQGNAKDLRAYSNFHFVYNDYRTLRIFRKSKNKMGLGLAAGYTF